MDLPAAHSMDTRWFGVDDEGHVAVLFTGEIGPIATDWTGGEEGFDIVARLLAGGSPFELSREAALPPDPQILRMPGETLPRDWEREFDLLLRLAHPRVLDLLPAARRLEACPAVVPFAYIERMRDQDLLSSLLERGLIERAWCRTELVVPLGLYYFVADWSQPYTRVGLPGRPLTLAELPAEVARLAVRLPGLSFRERENFSLAAVVDCRWWGE